MDLTQIGSVLLLMVLCSDWNHDFADGLTTTASNPVTLTSSAQVALVNDSLTFTCHVTGSLAGTTQTLSISHNASRACQVTTTTCMDIRGVQPCSCVMKNGVRVYQHHVTRVQRGQEGEWLCAVGDSGVSSSLVQAVAARPFGLRLTGVSGSSVKAGEQAVFHCSAQGDPHPDLTLTLESNGTSLATTNQSEASLTFTVTAQLDGAMVNCLASNSYGNVSSNLQVNVECAKTGTQVTVTPAIPLLGRSADVKCHVTQPPQSASHDVVLAHNGDPVCAAKLHSCLDTGLLPGCGCVLEQGQTVYQFSLSNVSQADQGNWSCQVTQRCAQSSSSVQVESSPFGVQFPALGQKEVVTLTENEVTSVQCEAFGFPRPHITWSVKGNVTEGEEGDATLGTLRLLPSRTMHGQEVTCTASNKHGVATLRRRMDVSYAPSATISATFNSNAASVELVCRADGNPHSFHWDIQQQLGNTTVRSLNGTEAGDTYTVRLYNVTVEDTGTYVCLVCNSVGNNSSPLSPNASVDVQVEGAPLRAYDTPSTFFAEAGTDAEIRVHLYSCPEIIALYSYWRRNPTQPLNSAKYRHSIGRGMVNVQFHDTKCTMQGSVSALRILNFQVTDAGTYLHHVCNRIECNTQLYTIVVSGDPWPPSHLQAVSFTEQSVTLQWTAGFPGGDFSVWFQVDYRRHGDENWTSVMTPESRQEAGSHVTFIMDRLPPSQMFYFRVRAHSDRPGSSNFTEETMGATGTHGAAREASGDGGIGKGVAIGFAICLVLVAGIISLLVCLARRYDAVARIFLFGNLEAVAPDRTRVPRVLADEETAAPRDFPGNNDAYTPLLSTPRTSYHDIEEYLGPPPSTRCTSDPQPPPTPPRRNQNQNVNWNVNSNNSDELVYASTEHVDPAPSTSLSIDPDAKDLDQTTVPLVPADEGNAASRDIPGSNDRYSYAYSSSHSTRRSSHHGREEYLVPPPSTRCTSDPQHPPTPPPRRNQNQNVNRNVNSNNSDELVYASTEHVDPAPSTSLSIDPDAKDLASMGEHQREQVTDTESSMGNDEMYDDAFPASMKQPQTPPLPPRNYLQRGQKKNQDPPRGEEMNTENLPTGPDGSSENRAFSGEESVPPEATAAPTLSGPSSPNAGPENQGGDRSKMSCVATVPPAKAIVRIRPTQLLNKQKGVDLQQHQHQDHYYSSHDPEETAPKTRRETDQELQTDQNKTTSNEDEEIQLQRLLQSHETPDSSCLPTFTINRPPLNTPQNEASEPESNTMETRF